jgi:hypothetical protein
MLSGISHARVEAGKLLLSRNSRQIDAELEGGVFEFQATSIDLIARTTIEFENSWHVGGEKVNGDSYAKRANYIEMPSSRLVSDAERGEAKFSIHAEMSSNSMIYGFQGEHFQGQAKLIMLHIASADETRAAAGFQIIDPMQSRAGALDISLQLKHELFQSTFRPLWLGIHHATIDLRLGICGFQQDHELPADLVMASGVWSVELRSIVLSTRARHLD